MEQKKRVKFVNKDKTQFLKTLKQRVDNYFTDNNPAVGFFAQFISAVTQISEINEKTEVG